MVITMKLTAMIMDTTHNDNDDNNNAIDNNDAKWE